MTLVAASLDVKILPLLLLLLAHLLHSLLNDGGEVLDGREVVDDLGKHNQRVPDGHKVLALQTDDKCLGNLVMPLVADVPVVLKVNSVRVVAICLDITLQYILSEYFNPTDTIMVANSPRIGVGPGFELVLNPLGHPWVK